MPLEMVCRWRRAADRAACAPRRFTQLHRVPWLLVLDFLIEVPTELDEAAAIGMESLGRLSNCSRLLRSCIDDRVLDCFFSVVHQSQLFMSTRAASLGRHPNLILRGRIWQAYEESRWERDEMHVTLGEQIQDQQERLRELGECMLEVRGPRSARRLVAETVRVFLQHELLDVNVHLRLLERSLA
ncbi:FCPE [Symbiodinium sp. CCMP2592]|nr:FCPE [Symbiodinium sp. CCMP2592]